MTKENRYIRQIVLEEIGKEGQKKILAASVAIIGIGALGTVSSELLVRSGVGKILLVDKDVVDIVNLQRQLLFSEDDVGKKKVIAAKERLTKINFEVKIDIVEDFLDDENVSVLKDYDLILDCTDNMRARHVINDFCEKNNKKWIYAAASGIRGNVLVVENYAQFRKIFNSGETFDSCRDMGVINALINIISSLQVTECLKLIIGENYCKDLIRFDVWNNSYQKIKLT